MQRRYLIPAFGRQLREHIGLQAPHHHCRQQQRVQLFRVGGPCATQTAACPLPCHAQAVHSVRQHCLIARGQDKLIIFKWILNLEDRSRVTLLVHAEQLLRRLQMGSVQAAGAPSYLANGLLPIQ